MSAMKRRLSLSRHKSTAGSVPEFLKRSELWAKIASFSSQHLNFYRIHLLMFTFVPLIISGIFFASNAPEPRSQIAYIDCLFLCVSAMTVTGLNSVELGRLTTWQQFLLFFQMSIGSTSFVSIIVVMVRRQFFRNKFDYLVRNDENARKRVNEIGEQEARLHGRSFEPFTENHMPGKGPSLAQLFFNRSQPNTPRPSPAGSASASFVEGERERGLREGLQKKKKKLEKLSADMIRRIDVPVRINEMSVSGWLGEGREEEDTRPHPGDVPMEHIGHGDGKKERLPEVFHDEDSSPEDGHSVDGQGPGARTGVMGADGVHRQPSMSGRTIQISEPPAPQHGHIQISEPPHPVHTNRGRRASDTAATASPLRLGTGNLPRVRTLDPRHLDHITESPTASSPRRTSFGSNPDHNRDFGRSRTIEFRENHDNDLRLRRNRTGNIDPDVSMRRMSSSNLREPHSRTLTRTGTANGPPTDSARTTGFGGFPNPIRAAAGVAAGYAKSRIPTLRNAVDRTVTRTTTLRSTHSIDSRMGTTTFAGSEGPNVKQVNYISFDAVVGRNSRFHGLTDAQREELGGVEYRALTLLLKLVAGYYLVGQLLAVLVLAPWLSHSNTYQPVFDDPAWKVNPTWFTFFQVWSAFSNNGMSLVDTSMVPFGRAYWLIIVMSILIVGGNTGLPVFLRLTIWTLSKVVPSQSRIRETLEFLLAHPRRCYIYLFPSHETWYLVFALVCLNGFDWASFMILDIGNDAIETIPLGTRFIDGLFQSFAVRAAGFGIVPLGQLSPAVQFLYTVMMYIAVYPIALSIRSTNVYEEKSMGVYDEDLDESEAEAENSRSATQYIGFHARKQLAWDIWAIVLAVWLLAIIERGRIRSGDWPEVNVFTLIFESVSAYGTVGLSLGNGRNNASLSGVLSTLSKLVLIALMIRGRHRGLPIAIDRAVLLPSDLEAHFDDTVTSISQEGPLPRTRTSRSSYTGVTEVEDARSRTNSIFVDSPQVIESPVAFNNNHDDDDELDEVKGRRDAASTGGGTTPSSATESKDKSVESESDRDTTQPPPHDKDEVGWR